MLHTVIRIFVFLLYFLSIPPAIAAGICDGFAIKLKNNLSEDILVTNINTTQADLEPAFADLVKAGSQITFSIVNASRVDVITGNISLYTVQIPSKKITIAFELMDKGIYCRHSDKSTAEEHHPSSTRVPGRGVDYNIDY